MARKTVCAIKGTDQKMTKIILTEKEVSGMSLKIAGAINASGGYVTTESLVSHLIGAVNQAQCDDIRRKLGLEPKEAPTKAGDEIIDFDDL